jgi:hypothetical protein
MELGYGNVNLLLALAVVAGFRWPAAWAFVLLTKVTPGVGLLWFAVRQEWRSLAIALGATALVCVPTLLAPDLWRQWFGMLAAEVAEGYGVPVPLVARVPMAALPVAWGARTDRRWTVPVAAVWALPTSWVNGLVLLVGCIPLVVSPSRAAARSRSECSVASSRTAADP